MLSTGKNRLPRRARISEAGFTLVEMMVVLVIIGLMSSAVILTFPRSKPALEQQSEMMLKGVNAMAQASLISGTPAALALSEEQYALMQFQNGEWITYQKSDFLPEIDVEFTGEADDVELSDTLIPLVLFEPNGLSTPFRLTLSDAENVAILESQGNGRVIRGQKS